jgi:Nucleotidyltransferase domain
MRRPPDEGDRAAVLDALDAIRSGATEIVLFGSRATGDATRKSDWDLVVVSDHKPLVARRDIDLVWIPRNELESSSWLGSELAQHVARYGMWLRGEGRWKTSVFASETAVARKVWKIRRRTAVLSRVWPSLSPGLRAKHLRLVRRDLQRLRLLMLGEPVPASHQLDASWGGAAGELERALLTDDVVRRVSTIVATAVRQFFASAPHPLLWLPGRKVQLPSHTLR